MVVGLVFPELQPPPVTVRINVLTIPVVDLNKSHEKITSHIC